MKNKNLYKEYDRMHKKYNYHKKNRIKVHCEHFNFHFLEGHPLRTFLSVFPQQNGQAIALHIVIG